jgi:Ca-activated chloride channel homolog
MRFQYSNWREDSQTDEQRLEALLKAFSYLVLKTNGDVQEALEWLRELGKRHGIFDDDLDFQELIQKLQEMGIIEIVRGSPQLTPRGIKRIRRDALSQIFTSLKKSAIGTHETPYLGQGVESISETRKWKYGDLPTNINLTNTLTNAFARDGIDDFHLTEDDLEVYETELLTGCATVCMIDISHSMVLYGEDRITPAKQVALALAEYIRQKFPKDYLAVTTFGDDAKLVSLAEVPFLSAGPYHTNTRAGLQLARSLLRHHGNANKQIFMITDGKPSAMFDDNGRLYKNPYGLDPRIINKTLDEAMICRREKITVSTFMLARDPALVDFVQEFTKTNHGRAYYSALDDLGEFLFVDYIRNRRKKYSFR